VVVDHAPSTPLRGSHPLGGPGAEAVRQAGLALQAAGALYGLDPVAGFQSGRSAVVSPALAGDTPA